MPGRIEQDDPGLAGLGLDPLRSELDAASGGGLEVIDGQVEMELLVPVVGPRGSSMVRDTTDAQGVAGAGEHRVLLLQDGDRPAQHRFPEAGEGLGPLGIEGDHGQTGDGLGMRAGVGGSSGGRGVGTHACHTAAMSSAADWTNATPRQMLGHVLRPEQLLERATYDSAPPHPDLAGWVERYWSVGWELGAGETCRTSTLDEPSVHVTRERGGVRRAKTTGPGAWITGPVTRSRFDVELSGSGDVIGIKFRVGGLLAFLGTGRRGQRGALDMRRLRDATVPAHEWFEGGGPPADLPDGARAASPLLDAWLLDLRPREPDGCAAFRETLGIIEDPEVTTLAELERRTGRTARSLQRLLDHFVGVSPKRMLMRARVIDAVACLDAGDDRHLADIAQDLGWFDQSHFIRDFRAIIGQTPSAYRQRERAPHRRACATTPRAGRSGRRALPSWDSLP